MVPDFAAVMDALPMADVESYISLRKSEIPGLADMITTLTGVWDHFSFSLRYTHTKLCKKCILSSFPCHIPAVQNVLITSYFHCWNANTPVCSAPSYGL